jgi:hypothetical protein
MPLEPDDPHRIINDLSRWIAAEKKEHAPGMFATFIFCISSWLGIDEVGRGISQGEAGSLADGSEAADGRISKPYRN